MFLFESAFSRHKKGLNRARHMARPDKCVICTFSCDDWLEPRITGRTPSPDLVGKDKMPRLRIIEGPAKDILDRLCKDHVFFTNVRIITTKTDTLISAPTFIRETMLSMEQLFSDNYLYVVNPLARPGHDLCIRRIPDACFLGLTKHQYERFGIQKGKNATDVIIKTDCYEKARKAARRMDTGPFGTPPLVHILVALKGAEKKVLKPKMSYTALPSTDLSPQEWIEGLCQESGDNLMFFYEEAIIPTVDLLPAMDTAVVFIGRALHDNLVVVIRRDAPDWITAFFLQ